jgi:hypothetical protein
MIFSLHQNKNREADMPPKVSKYREFPEALADAMLDYVGRFPSAEAENYLLDIVRRAARRQELAEQEIANRTAWTRSGNVITIKIKQGEKRC